MTTTVTTWATCNAIAREAGSAPHHVARWLKADGVPSQQQGTRTLFDHDAGLAAVAAHQRPRQSGPSALAVQAADIASLRRELHQAELTLAGVAERLAAMKEAVQAAPEKAPESAWVIQSLEEIENRLK